VCTLKKKFLTATLALTILFLFVSNVYAHTITVPVNAYFGFCNNCYIKFASAQSFGTVYRENSYWYFDSYAFQIQNGNMTVNTFFVRDELELKVTAETGKTSTTQVYVADKGEPTIVSGADSWSYNGSTKIVTLTESDVAIITLAWTPFAPIPPTPPPPYVPPPEPTPPPYIPPIELPKLPGVEFTYGIIVLVGIVGVAVVVSIAGRTTPSLESRWKKKTRTKTRNLNKKWRKKRR